MGQRLPATALHRFPGEPRPGTDVDVYEWDGAQYVAASRKGVSFLNIYDSGSAGRSYHGSFQGSCSLMAPGAELSEGFSMVKGSALRWPPKQRGVPRHLQLEGQVVGWHYALVPQHNMPLVSYTAEVERIKSTACTLVAAACATSTSEGDDEPPPGPEDWLEPCEGAMVWVAYALRALNEAKDEPASVRSTAWVLLASICAADTSFDQLLLQPDVAAWALAAMEQYKPPEDDLVADSICWDVELRLREALQGQGVEQIILGF